MLIDQRVHLLGVRHHGPGSAASVVKALSQIKPEVILIEGPAEAEPIAQWVAHTDMKPPVAMMIYDQKSLKNAVYYPFAEFSPEWQAIQHSLKNGVDIRFFDLPQSYQFYDKQINTDISNSSDHQSQDPIELLATAAGFEDSEAWWEFAVEQRLGDCSLFTAIAEAMIEVRNAIESEQGSTPPLREQRREAWMRKQLKKAKAEYSGNIAIVCGAWHVPALINKPTIKADNEILKGMRKAPVSATWIPWTYQRLSTKSGYGAGIEAPVWYDILFRSSKKKKKNRQISVPTKILTAISRHLRSEGHDTSAARVIDAVQLCSSLSYLREQPIASLAEIEDAALATLFKGNETLKHETLSKLLIGDKIGTVSKEVPNSPLQKDFHSKRKKYRLDRKKVLFDLNLDLRKHNDLEKSAYLHQLLLLDITWATKHPVKQTESGTFKEKWSIEWTPEIELELIDAGYFGSTISEACTNKVIDELTPNCECIGDLIKVLRLVMLAGLTKASEFCIKSLSDLTAVSHDIAELMTGLPELVSIMRYGDVRNTHKKMLCLIVDSIIPRITIGLPGAVTNIDTESSDLFAGLCRVTHRAIILRDSDEMLFQWIKALTIISDSETVKGIISGTACRQLLDSNKNSFEQAKQKMHLRFQSVTEYEDQAFWISGFIHGSASTLLYDENLWQLIHQWLCGIPEDDFMQLLPLLRKAFSFFSVQDRHKIMEKLRGPKIDTSPVHLSASEFDSTAAEALSLNLLRYYGAL